MKKKRLIPALAAILFLMAVVPAEAGFFRLSGVSLKVGGIDVCYCIRVYGGTRGCVFSAPNPQWLAGVNHD